MSIPNELTAKVLGDIIARGMNMSDFDLGDKVESEAINALDEIRLVMYNGGMDDSGKINSIGKIMERYKLNTDSV